MFAGHSCTGGAGLQLVSLIRVHLLGWSMWWCHCASKVSCTNTVDRYL